MPADNPNDQVKLIEAIDELIYRWQKFRDKHDSTEKFIETFFQDLTKLWKTSVILYALLSLREQPSVEPNTVIGSVAYKVNKIDEQVIDKKTKENCDKKLNKISVLGKEKGLAEIEELIKQKYIHYNEYKEKVLRHAYSLQNLIKIRNIVELGPNAHQTVKTIAQTLINYSNTNWSDYKTQLARILPIAEEEDIATKKITAATVGKIMNMLATDNTVDSLGILNIIKGNLLINKPLASVESVLQFTEQLKLILEKHQTSENLKVEPSNTPAQALTKNRSASLLSFLSKPSPPSSQTTTPQASSPSSLSKKAMPPSPTPASSTKLESDSLQGKQLPRSVLDEFRNKAMREKDANEKDAEKHDSPNP